MRLLFDEQLSDALPALLDDVFPGSLHVRALVGVGASDERVWELAIEHACILVSKDEDFHRLSVLRGAPPKVVWLRIGNCTTDAAAALLRGSFRRSSDWIAATAPATRTSHGDHDLPSAVTSPQIPEGVRDFAQRERSVDDRCDLAALDELLQQQQILLVRRGRERPQVLAHER